MKEDDVRSLAKVTTGFSGADLSNMVNEAALLTAREGLKIVKKKQVEEARDKVLMGPQLKSKVMTEAQKHLTAYHEAGHALVAKMLSPITDPINKATIEPRGHALGFVEQRPDEDRYGHKKNELEARLAVCMAGRVAEELIFGKNHVSNGAQSDFKSATRLAYMMVTQWGMSEKVGSLHFPPGGGFGLSAPFSGTGSGYLQNMIEMEIQRLLNDAENTARVLIKKHKKKLHALAAALLERETLSGSEIDEILNIRTRTNHNHRKNKFVKLWRNIQPDTTT